MTRNGNGWSIRCGRDVLLACWLALAGPVGVLAQEVIPDYYNEPGLNPNRQYVNQAANEHVDPFTGALQLHYVDIHLPGNGKFDLQLVRSYNSSVSTPFDSMPPSDYAPAGLGWTMHFGRVLSKAKILPCAGSPAADTRNNPVLELPDGSRQLLAYTANGSPALMTTRRWKADCMAGDTTQGFVVYSPDGTRYEMTRYMFGVTGNAVSPLSAWYATKIVDRNGNSASISYGGDLGRAEIQNVTTNDGRSISFTYSGGLITQVAGSGGQSYQYKYTPIDGGKHQLTTVIRPDGTEWKYDYNGPVANATGGGSFAMNTLTYPQGGVITYAYDRVLFNSLATTHTSVIKERNAGGSAWIYQYTPGKPGHFDTTTVTGPDGVTTYQHIGVNCTAPNTTCGSGSGDSLLYAVGALVTKQIGDLQVESYGYSPQTISPQPYVVPGLWATFAQGDVAAPVLTGKSIGRDGAGYNTTYGKFDGFGNPTQIVEEGSGVQRTIDLTYHVDAGKWILHQVKDVTVSGGSVITRSFDGSGNMTLFSQDGVSTAYTYDSQGNLDGELRPGGRSHRYGGYERGLPTWESHPEGVSISRSVSAAGNVTSETNGNGNMTSYSYDGLNRLTSINYPIGGGVSIAYGTSVKSANRGGLSEITVYDAFGRPLGVTLGGITRSFGYDSSGRMTYASNPGGLSGGTSYSYDALNRVTQITNQDGSAKRIAYGPGSKTVTDERGQATTYHYRAHGDPDKTYLVYVDPPDVNARFAITRDARDRVTEISQGAYGTILKRTFAYDNRNYLVSVVNPETGITTYGRDEAGNMTSRQVGSSGVTNYVYDGLNRLTDVIYPGTTPAVKKTYTRTGKLDTVTAAGGTRKYSYDTNENLTGESITVDGNVFDIGYTFDNLDHLSSITYPISGNVVSYAPDALGRPTRASNYVASASYWPSGQIKEIQYGNGVASSYGQNERLWPSGFTTRSANGIYLESAYGYDGAGNITSIADSVDTNYNRTLGYDGLNRLISTSGPWGTGTVGYDGAGNIGYQYLGNAKTNYQYDAGNRLVRLTGAQNTLFTYDAYGNMATGYGVPGYTDDSGYPTTSTGGYTYTYDDAPNLVCVNCSNAVSGVRYTYDGLNQRTRITRAGVTTYEVYAANGHLLAEFTPAQNNKLVESIYLGGKRIAQRRTGGIVEAASAITLVAKTFGIWGRPATFVATVTGNNPSGVVVFKEGGAVLGTSDVVSGQATLTISTLLFGVHSISADYRGDVNNSSSSSSVVSYTVHFPDMALVSLGLSGAEQVMTGDAVTLIATASGGMAVGGMTDGPSGAVTFKEGETVLGSVPMSARKASLTITLPKGTHNIVATYEGDLANRGAISNSFTVVVGDPVFDLIAPTGPVAVGQQTLLLARVDSHLDCAGTVTFYDGTSELGTVPACVLGADTSAHYTQLVSSFSSAGMHALSAVYVTADQNRRLTTTAVLEVQAANAPARFTKVTDAKFDDRGNLYVADGRTVRVISPTGDVKTLLGAQHNRFLFDATNGVAGGYLQEDCTLAVDKAGNVFVNTGPEIRKIAPAGNRTVLVEGAYGVAGGMAFDANGNLFVADPGLNEIRKVAPDGAVTPVAGQGAPGNKNGTALVAMFNHPTALAFDSMGNLFVADSGNHTIRKISPDGTVTTIAGTAGIQGNMNGVGAAARFSTPFGLAIDGSGNLLVSEAGNYDIRQITPDGRVTTLAGQSAGNANGTPIDAFDGTERYAQFSLPSGLAVAADGALFVADGASIRKVAAGGVVTTYAGQRLLDPQTGRPISGVADGRINDTTLIISPSAALLGQEVVLQANVGGQNPTGTVAFHDGDNALGSATLVSGQATLKIANLTVGTHHLSADYSGDANNPASRSIDTRMEVGVSTTELQATPNPVLIGDSVTLSATVTGTNPSGTVTFMDGASELGTAPLSGGKASLSTAVLAAGSHTLSAGYGGDASNNPSRSSPQNLTVNDIAETTTTLIINVGSSPYGNKIILTGKVRGIGPTGTVTFMEGDTVVTSATVGSNSMAIVSLATLPVGTHNLTAVYQGDRGNTSSTSSEVSVVITNASTSTALAVSPSPADYGAAVKLTATITGGIPTGSITFMDGTTTLGTVPVAAGKASLTTTALAAGSHTLSANYSGDTQNDPSTSPAVSLTVNSTANTTTTLIINVSSSPYGSKIILTGKVKGSSPTGTVTFMEGTTPVTSATVGSNSMAIVSLATLPVGTHNLTAVYGGDAINTPSTSSAVSVTITSASTSTSTALAVSPNPADYGSAVNLTATITGGNPTGNITFLDGTTTLGTATVAAGKASLTTSALTAGSHTLSAQYSGDTQNDPSTSPAVSLTVNSTASTTNTTTTLIINVGSSPYGSKIILTGKVRGSSPTGTVTFKEGSTPVTSATVGSNSMGIVSLATLPVGTHNLTAVYGGDAINTPSTSSAVGVTITKATTSTALAASPSPATYGAAVKLTATITGGIPTGSITFLDGTTTLGTVAVASGKASLSIKTLAKGTHNLSASYGGDAQNTGSASATVGLTVQ